MAQTTGRRLGATLIFSNAALLLLALSADAARVPVIGGRLRTLETRSSLNNFDPGTTDGGCTLATGTVPEGMVFVVYDVVCSVAEHVLPLQNNEKLLLAVVDGRACSGGVRLETTFGSDDGLRYSPNLPFYAGPDMSISMRRRASLNPGTVQVSCSFHGTYQRAPEP